MNKKAYTLTATVVFIVLIVSLAIMFFLLFAPEGLLEKAADEGDKLADEYLPTKDSKKFDTETGREEAIADSFYHMLSAFKAGAQNKDLKECLWFFTKPPELNDYRIKITERPEGGALFELINEKGQIADTDIVENIELCAVAGKKGKEDRAEIFFERYLVGKIPNTEKNKLDTFITGKSVEIYEPGIGTDSEFRFITDTGKEYRGWNLDYEGAEYNGKQTIPLFHLDNKHICFIPTTNHYNHHEDGIEDKFIKNIRDYVLDDCLKGGLTSPEDAEKEEVSSLVNSIRYGCVSPITTGDEQCTCEAIHEIYNLREKNDITFKIDYGNLIMALYNFQGEDIIGPYNFGPFSYVCIYDEDEKKIGKNGVSIKQEGNKLIAYYTYENQARKTELGNPLKFYVEKTDDPNEDNFFCLLAEDAPIPKISGREVKSCYHEVET